MTAADDASGARGTVRGPLSGVCVLVTRAPHQAAALAGPLAALGAEVLVAPVIDTVDPASWGPADSAIGELATYDWVVLTSTNAVDRFVERMRVRGVPLEVLRQTRVAVVGAATAERLAERGIVPDLVPDDSRAEGLIDGFRAAGIGAGTRFLLPRAEEAREILPEMLREAGAIVDVVAVYRTVPARPDPGIVRRLAAGEIDVVTFTSSSTVRHFLAWVEGAGLEPRRVMETAAAASIGPVTSEALRARGYRVPIEAPEPTMDSLVRAISSADIGHHESW